MWLPAWGIGIRPAGGWLALFEASGKDTYLRVLHGRCAPVHIRRRTVGVPGVLATVHPGRSRCIPMVGSCEVRRRFPVLREILHRVVDLDEGGFNREYDVKGKDRLRVYRPRDGALPRLQHLLHLASHRLVNPCIRLHKSAVQLGRDI